MDNSQSFELPGFIILICACGYAFIFYPIKKILEGLNIKINGQQTYGEVVDNMYKKGTEGETYNYPVIHFTTIEGDLVEYESDTGYSERYRIGKRLVIYYMPDEPTKVYIANYSVMFYVFFLLIGITVLTLLTIQLTKTI
jgi:hypothetical protein